MSALAAEEAQQKSWKLGSGGVGISQTAAKRAPGGAHENSQENVDQQMLSGFRACMQTAKSQVCDLESMNIDITFTYLCW